MIDIKDILTLSDNNRYVVANKVNYEGKTYLYLMDIDNNSNIKFCYLDNNQVVLCNNDLDEKILLEFYKNTKSILNNEL